MISFFISPHVMPIPAALNIYLMGRGSGKTVTAQSHQENDIMQKALSSL